MNFVGNEYYKLNRRLLLLVGLWPYDDSSLKYCQLIFCNITVTFLVVCQIAKLITLRRNVNLMLKLLPPVILCFIYIIKYQTFRIVAEKIRYLMEHVEQDWNMLKSKEELEIIERYTFIGSMCTLAFSIIGFAAVLISLFLPFVVPIVLDILVPLNLSRPQQLLFPGEYFIDQQKYFYLIFLHFNISLSIILTTLIATESLYVTYVLHACGMFQIVSYRMNQAFDNKLFCTAEKRAIIVCKGITEAVHIHKRALEFSESLWSTLSVSYSILLIIGITSLLINLLCLLHTVLFIKEMNDIIILFLFNFGHLFYLFLGNYVGQILIDHSSGIFEKTYITPWYSAPLQAQKLLPMIMQRSMRSCKMVVGGMFTPSYEGFAALMSTTLSYFTVIWSVQK